MPFYRFFLCRCSRKRSRRINGTVTAPTGAVVPQAHVTATKVSTSTLYSTVASSAGEFNFAGLPLGTYKVTVIATVFQSVDVNGLSVTAGTVYTLPVKLSLAQQATTIEVAVNALTLDTTTTTQTTVLDNKALQDVPQTVATSRNFSAPQPRSPASATTVR